MKSKALIISAMSILGLAACQKANDSGTTTTLTASTTEAVVGQTVTVQLTSDKTASSWTVTPSATAVKAYAITTSKVNYFTFNQAGTYRVGVRVRNIAYDSTHHQDLDSSWHHGRGDAGGCHHGIDSSSVVIKVSN
jgi:hypothetical protein